MTHIRPSSRFHRELTPRLGTLQQGECHVHKLEQGDYGIRKLIHKLGEAAGRVISAGHSMAVLKKTHLEVDALDVIVIVEDGVLAGGSGVGGDSAAVEYRVAVPEHLHALAKILEALRLRVHRAPAVGCPAHAPAAQHTHIGLIRI